MDLKKKITKAVVTYFQVFLSVLLGQAVFSFDVATIKVAAVSAFGAVLSYVYNTINEWLAANPD